MKNIETTINPAGHVRLAPANDKIPADLENVADAFALSSAQGIVALQRIDSANRLSPSLIYWRDFGRTFFDRLCHVAEATTQTWKELPAPDEEVLQLLVDAAPPMRGIEFLTHQVLNTIWRGLAEHVSTDSRGAKQPLEYLQSINPELLLLGRVTFHLAENKADTQRPFAFMATYTNRLTKDSKTSNQTKIQHLPLGQAIKQYAGQQNQAALQSLLAPISLAAQRDTLTRELLDTKAIFQPQAWTVKQAHRLLLAGEVLESCGLVLRLPDWWRKGKSRRVAVNVEVGQKRPSLVGTNALLKFSANLALEGTKLSAAEAKKLLAADEPLIMLKGQWVEVDKEKLQQTLDHWESLSALNPNGIDFLSGMRLISGVSVESDEVDLVETKNWQFVSAGSWLEEKLDAMRNPTNIKHTLLRRGKLKGLNATLRPYQEAGVRWLAFLQELQIGGCLADDMGLGKTIQVISLLLLLKQTPKSKQSTQPPNLLVVPASLVGNWRQELEKFAPQLNVFYAHRSESTPEQIDNLAANLDLIAGYDLVITTYGLARRWEWLQETHWNMVILDEAQAIKNSGSAQTKSIKKLKSNTNFALTGTPVENHLGDLWSLFDFCCPGLLGSAKQFKSYVNRLQKSEVPQPFAPLRNLVRPYILRRMKTDKEIAPDLPGKTEVRCECTLSKKQVALYQKMVKQLAEKLESDDIDGIARRGLVLSSLMQFKQICNHPSQFLGQSDFAMKDSGKLQRLRELCKIIAERQEKLLLFTQFRSVTEPVAEFLSGEFDRPGLVLHGGTPVKRRKELVAEFQSDQGPPFFVISLKAGGAGLNLTAASHVIHFDRWWNPAVENQATDRAFRIGQKKNVLVHKFVCRGTIEENIDKMISDKQTLSDEVLGSDPDASQVITELDNAQLIKLVSLDLDRAMA